MRILAFSHDTLCLLCMHNWWGQRAIPGNPGALPGPFRALLSTDYSEFVSPLPGVCGGRIFKKYLRECQKAFAPRPTSGAAIACVLREINPDSISHRQQGLRTNQNLNIFLFTRLQSTNTLQNAFGRSRLQRTFTSNIFPLKKEKKKRKKIQHKYHQ